MLSRNQLKGLYFKLLALTRQDNRLLKTIRQKQHLVVLNLHQVSPHANPFWPPLHPRLFETLLVFLKANFQVVLFHDLDSVDVNQPQVILSFDDGYYDFIEYALPLLDKHGLRANMNVIPSCVESGEPIWNVKLYDFLNSAPKSLVDEIRLPGFAYRLQDESFQSKVQYGLKISRFLKNRPRQEREELWHEIEKLMRKIDFHLTRMLNPDEVRELSIRHEIGVHSFSHESMAFEDNEYFKSDLEKCSNYFANQLMIDLDIYAFPNGSYRPEQIGILKEHGLEYALLVDENYARKDLRLFPRFTIYGSSASELKFRALGFNQKG